MKNIALMLLIIGIAVVLVIGAVVANAISVAEQLGKNQSALTTDTTVLAEVGRYQITRYDVEKYRINQQFMIEIAKTGFDEEYTNAKLSDEEILAKLIENKLLFIEAENNGLIVSDEIIHDYLKEMIEIVNATESKDMSVVKDYIRGQNMTIDEFINSNFDNYKEQMSIGKLRGSITGGVIANYDDYSEITAKWEKYKTDLVQNNQSIIKIVKSN